MPVRADERAARPSGTHELDLVEAILGLPAAGGLPQARASWALDLLLRFAAAAAEQSTRQQSTDVEDLWDALATTLRGVCADRHPHIAAVGGELLGGTGRNRPAWGFQALIGGIPAAPEPDTADAPPATG